MADYEAAKGIDAAASSSRSRALVPGTWRWLCVRYFAEDEHTQVIGCYFEQFRKPELFLEAADMVKYAGQTPGGREVEESVDRAREFIGMPSAMAPMPQMQHDRTLATMMRAERVSPRLLHEPPERNGRAPGLVVEPFPVSRQ